MIGENICELSAHDIAAAVRSRQLSPQEVVSAALTRMERLEPKVHAFCTPMAESARGAAERIEKLISDGADPGPLAGVPVAIKDTILVQGVRCAQGSVAYANFIAEEDDIVVERLKAAGAIVLGKTNVPEFAYAGVGHNPLFETTRNPWNPSRTSGGSSAGSAAAVASGMAPLALGSDAGGSIRIPAAFCGLVGVKPSWGRVPLFPGCRDPRYPGLSSWEFLEHIGPMTRTVADAALALSVIAGPDPRDRHSIPCDDVDWQGAATHADVAHSTIAFSPDLGYAIVDPEVAAIAEAAAQRFESALGCRVARESPDLQDEQTAFWALVVFNSDLRGMRALVAEHRHAISPHLVDLLERDWTAEELTDGHLAQKRTCRTMARFMDRYDLLLTPTAAVPPFDIGLRGPETIAGRSVPPTKWTALTFPFNLTGQPVATVPAGWTADGLPVGLQIVGRHLDDERVLAAAAAYEAIAPWHDRWPAMVEASHCQTAGSQEKCK